MNAKNDLLLEEEPVIFMLKDLSVRVVGEHEYERAHEALEREHYLGDLPQGRGLLQAVEYRGRWVALLDWGSASLKLSDREEWIGWTHQQRAERLPLVVMNRRFLVLGRTRMANLASRALSLATRALPGHWEQLHGYRPVLAETFTDMERFEGTCYKAANWIECGHTKGFRRHRADYYQRHGRPKKLWLKPLARNARVILTAMDVPAGYRAGCNRHSPERDLPIGLGEVASLRAHLAAQVADPRRDNRSFPCSSLLALVAMALLAGRSTLASIQRYGQFMSPRQRQALDWPWDKQRARRKAPSYSALRNLLVKVDPNALAEAISAWLQGHLGQLPRALAVDGKWVRDQVLTVCLTDHETGAPVAIGIAGEHIRRRKQKREGEQTVARKLYAASDLHGAVITGDALYNSRPDADAMLRAGADYLLQVKQENRHSYHNAERLALTTPLLPTPKSPTAPTDASTPGT